MQLHLEILPRAQRELWDQLSTLPDAFVLYGGTAIALQLGHRQSVDFDFFARLAGMKAMVVQKRAEAKDYIDLHALIHQARIDLPSALAAGAYLYPPHFAPELTLKSLCYFEDGNLATVPHSIRQDLARAVRGVDLQVLPVLLPDERR